MLFSMSKGEDMRKRLLIYVILFIFTVPTFSQNSDQGLISHLTYLASDKLEGRGPGTHGIDLAAEYFADNFKEYGNCFRESRRR